MIKTNPNKLVYPIVLLLMLAVLIFPACGQEAGNEESAVPVLNEGDSWIAQSTVEGIQYTLIYVVIGEEVVDGIDCYIVELTNEPSLMGMNKSIARMDKATLDPIRGQLQGEIMGGPFVNDMEYSYEYSGQHYPLKVGNKWEVTENLTSTFTLMGETETDTEQNTYTYKVEKTEDISVPAGTFSCFKILKYDDTDSLLSTSWISDETKHFDVKEINNQTGDETRLISYTLAD